MSSRWLIYDRKEKDLIDHLAAIRGLNSKDLMPDFSKHLHDPSLLPDIDKAVALIKEAREKNIEVAIFGDYDADGTPAAALISTVFDRLTIKHQVVLPTRKTGYGLNKSVVEEMSKTAKLLITVDTGISSVDEISLAKELGMKVVVIDHHLPKKTLPPADAIIDPYVDGSTYPFNGLCGCALAYKVIVALGRVFPDELTEGFCKWLLDLVAISTVSDMMPLIDENRAFVHYGLKVLAKTKRVGLDELMKVAGLSRDSLNSQSIGFAIGPRLNASGRLSDNRPAFDLLKETDRGEAEKLAQQINEANIKRQQLVKKLSVNIEDKIWDQNDTDDHLIVVVGDAWPSGILGLAAGKVSAQLNKPAIVLSSGPGGLSGSGRSVEHYSLIDGLEHSSKHLSRFGGHKLAAGLATTEGNLPKFVDTIKAHAKKNIKAEDLDPKIKIDAELTDEEVGDPTIDRVSTMEPFGFGNPSPIFLLRSVNLLSPKSIGSKSDHLKSKARVGDKELDVIGFGLSERYFSDPYSSADLVGSLEHNVWRGNKTLQFRVKDFRPAGSVVDGSIALPE